MSGDLSYVSYANRANLSEAWFKATEALPPAEREAMIMNQAHASDRVGLFGMGQRRTSSTVGPISEDMEARISYRLGIPEALGPHHRL